MIEKNFIKSNSNKFEKLFYKRKINSIITLFDDDDESIDNVIYIKIDNDNYLGIFINGTNPYFSDVFFEDIDSFNLYENYNNIKYSFNDIGEFYVESIKMIFNSDYNELAGLYLSNKLETKSLSIIFMGDELMYFEDFSSEKFNDELNNNLLHIKSKKICTITDS